MIEEALSGIFGGGQKVSPQLIMVFSYCKGHTNGSFYSTVKHNRPPRLPCIQNMCLGE